MKAPSFGGKPSDSHVIWRGSGSGGKRFDERRSVAGVRPTTSTSSRRDASTRAFVEIDSDGKARVKGWTTEGVVDVTELRVDGPSLVFEAVEFDDTKPLDARVLAQRPE